MNELSLENLLGRSKDPSPVPPTLLSAMLRDHRPTKSNKGLGSLRKSTSITTPRECDILFGRGGVSNNAEGNRVYQKVIEQWSGVYSTLQGRNAKTALAWTIYHQMKDQGFRFLKKDKGGDCWTEAPEEACRKKISQRLRERALEVKDEYALTPATVVHSTQDNVEPKNEEYKFDFSGEIPQADDARYAFDNASVIDPTCDDSIKALEAFVDDFPISWISPSPELAVSTNNVPANVFFDIAGLELLLSLTF